MLSPTSQNCFLHTNCRPVPLLLLHNNLQQRVRARAIANSGNRARTMNEDNVKAEALRLLGSVECLPSLVVFDLDYTLWPFWCECMSKRDNPSLYPQVNGILKALKEKGVSMAVASRTPTPDIATVFSNGNLSKLEPQGGALPEDSAEDKRTLQ